MDGNTTTYRPLIPSGGSVNEESSGVLSKFCAGYWVSFVIGLAFVGLIGSWTVLGLMITVNKYWMLTKPQQINTISNVGQCIYTIDGHHWTPERNLHIDSWLVKVQPNDRSVKFSETLFFLAKMFFVFERPPNSGDTAIILQIPGYNDTFVFVVEGPNSGFASKHALTETLGKYFAFNGFDIIPMNLTALPSYGNSVLYSPMWIYDSRGGLLLYHDRFTGKRSDVTFNPSSGYISFEDFPKELSINVSTIGLSFSDARMKKSSSCMYSPSFAPFSKFR